MPKKKKTRYPKSDKKDGAPFSRLEVYKELQAINERVEKIIENYEEFGPPTQLYITDEEVDHIRKLIEKFESIRLEKEAALKTVSAFYKTQLVTFMPLFQASVEADEKMSEELLKDVKHHEFQHAYDEALKGLDKLKTLITSTASLANLQLSYQPSSSTSLQDDHQAAKSPVHQEQNSYIQTSLQHSMLSRKYTAQQKELESTKLACKNLQQEKNKLMAIVSEVDKLKQELNSANREVEFLHKLVDQKKTMVTAGKETKTDQLAKLKYDKQDDDSSSASSSRSVLPPIVTPTDKDNRKSANENSTFERIAVKKNTFTVGRKSLKPEVINPVTASLNNKKTTGTSSFANTKLPDISHKTPSITHKPTNPVVKLPEITIPNLSVVSTSQEAASLNRQSPDDIKPQPISSEKIVKTLLDLHAKDQLNPQCLKNDYECIVKSVVKRPVNNLNKPNQLDKAARAIVEYTNMGQTIKEVDNIINEHQKQESREYQWITDKEEESKKAIIEHYSEFVESVISAVDFVNKQLQRDGIIGSGQVNGAATEHPVAFNQISKETEGTYQDFIGKIAEALTTISTSSALYLQHVNLSMIEQQKRLLVLKRANPQVYEKCIQQLDKDSQYPELISKRLQEGLYTMNSILDKHITEMRSEIDVFMCEREQLVEEAKLQMQAHVAEITRIAGRISTLLLLDGNKSISNPFEGLQTPIACLNKLCSKNHRIQAMKGFGESNKVAPLSETVKPALKEVQIKVKDMLCKELGVSMPHQLDYKVARKSHRDPQTTFPILHSDTHVHAGSVYVPAMDSTRDTSFAKMLTSKSNNNTLSSAFQPSFMWDSFFQSSPAAKETISVLSQGIQGKMIGKRGRQENGHFYPIKEMRSTSKANDIESLQIEGYGKKSGKKRVHPQKMSITITVKNRLVRDENPPKKPVEAFKVTSLNIKDRYN